MLRSCCILSPRCAMDLTKDVPRSPYEKLGSINFLPRSIDKARAELAGTLGDYVWRIGRTERLLDFLGIEQDEFIEAIRIHKTDQAVWAWIKQRMTPRSSDEIDAHNKLQATDEPKAGSTWDWPSFRGFLEDCGHGHRDDIRRHFDRLDLDEGREVPQGGRTDW
ncbi:MAG TPA: hypothetical protein DGO43_06035 [Chloroflexi bacterium]|nr:hypothetical protein [Chloroflexota bacterium]